MCGIVGVINPFSTVDKKVFEQLLTVDVLRGDHSTGVYNIHTSGSRSTYHKKPMPGNVFLASEERTLNTSVINSMSDAWVGHNRFATQGAINEDNAHPFAHGDIVLVHNGTLNDESYLPRSFATDSEGIAYALSQAKDAKDVLESLDGAFTLVWADLGKRTLNLARNNKRPMYLAKNKHRGSYYFASEKLMLEWILHRNNITVDEIVSLPVGKVYSFDMSRPSALKMEVTDFTPKPEPARYISYYSGWQQGSGSSSASSLVAYSFKESEFLNGKAKGRYGFTPVAYEVQGSTSLNSSPPIVWMGHLDEDDKWAYDPAAVRMYPHLYDKVLSELHKFIPNRARFGTRTLRDFGAAVNYVEFQLAAKAAEIMDLPVSNYPACLSDGAARVKTRLIQTYGTERAFYVDLFKLWGISREAEKRSSEYSRGKDLLDATDGTGMAIISVIAQDVELIPYGDDRSSRYYAAKAVLCDALSDQESLAALQSMYDKIEKEKREAKKSQGTSPNKGNSTTTGTNLQLVSTNRGGTGGNSRTTSRFKTCDMCKCATTNIVLNQQYALNVCQTCDDVLNERD